MEYSNLQLNARDIDTKKGIVSFYFADFNSVDSHGRRMNANSFNRTFNNNFKRFAHLLNHDRNTIIGKPLEVGTDTKGAFMISQLSKSSAGSDALIQYQEGIYNEHSFGFLIKDSVKDGKVEIVNELQMFEASTVTWGANSATPMISLNQVEDLLKRGDLSDKILEKLEFISNAIARLPVSEHQPPQKSDVDEVMNFIKKY